MCEREHTRARGMCLCVHACAQVFACLRVPEPLPGPAPSVFHVSPLRHLRATTARRKLRKDGRVGLPPAGHAGHCRQTACSCGVAPPGILSQIRRIGKFRVPGRILSSAPKQTESPHCFPHVLGASLRNSYRGQIAFWYHELPSGSIKPLE